MSATTTTTGAVAPPFDPSQLVHVEADAPPRTRSSASRWDVNPFLDFVASTFLDEAHPNAKGREVTLPANQVRALAGGLRDAADKLTDSGDLGSPVGLRLWFRFTGDDSKTVRTATITDVPTDKADTRPVTVGYQAKPRKRTAADAERLRPVGTVSA